MTTDLLFRLVGQFGLPITMFVAFIYFSSVGRLRWGREFEVMIAEKDRQIALITEDRDWWKQFGTRTLDVSEHATNVTAQAVTRRRT